MNRRPKCSDIPEALILRLCKEFHEKGPRLAPTPDVALADRFPSKVVLAKMNKLHDRGLIEYGVSLRTAWVTDKGLAVLGEERRKEEPRPMTLMGFPIKYVDEATRGPVPEFTLGRDRIPVEITNEGGRLVMREKRG
jgi:hypothetical protein